MFREKNIIYNFIIALFLAISISALFYAEKITSILTLIYITLIFGILGIFSIIVSVFCNNKKECELIYKTNLVANSIGAIISSFFALTICLKPCLISTTFLVGAVAFFLVSTIISLGEKIICTFCCKY